MARFLVKASEFKNVCKAVNDRKLAELKKEIIEILKKQDEKEVKKAIDYFESQELHYTHLEKSFNGKWVEKAGYGVGTVRIWKGKKYKKIAPGKWARVFEKEGRGTNIAIGKLIAKVQKIDNVEDLMAFVMANKQRFVDENGVDLPVLDKLRAAVDARNGSVGSKTSGLKLSDKELERLKEQNMTVENLRHKGYTDEEIKEFAKPKASKEEIRNQVINGYKNKSQDEIEKDLAYLRKQIKSDDSMTVSLVGSEKMPIKDAIEILKDIKKNKPAEKKSPEKLLKEMGFETMEKVSFNGDKWEVAGVNLDYNGNANGISLTPDRQAGNLHSSNVTVFDIDKIQKNKPAEKYDVKAYEDEKENILRHTNKDYDSVDAALKDMYAHKNWIDRKPSDETEHEKTVRESRLKAVDDIIEGLKNGDKKLLDKFVKEKPAEKTYQDKLNEFIEGGKKELGRGNIYKLHISKIQQLANTDIPYPESVNSINDFIKYQDKMDNPNYKQAGKDHAKLQDKKIAREIFDMYEKGEAEFDDKGYLKLNENGLIAKPSKSKESDSDRLKRKAEDNYGDWSKKDLESELKSLKEKEKEGYNVSDDREQINYILENKDFESEKEKHQNRSEAMKGNKNAYKGGSKEELQNELMNLSKQKSEILDEIKKTNGDLAKINQDKYNDEARGNPTEDYDKQIEELKKKIDNLQDEHTVIEKRGNDIVKELDKLEKEENKLIENNPESLKGIDFVNKNKMHALANFLANHDNVNMATAVVRLQKAYERLGEEKFLSYFPKEIVEKYRKEAGKAEPKKETPKFTPKEDFKSMSDDELKDYEAKLEKDLLNSNRTDSDYMDKYNHWREVHGENNDRFHQAIEDEVRAEKQAEADAKSVKEKEINEKYNGYFENRKGLDKARDLKTLEKKYNFDGKVMSSKEFVEQAMDNGVEINEREVNKLDYPSRTRWNRMNGYEQDEYEKRIKAAGKKTVYSIDGYEFPKTVVDYAKFYKEKKGNVKKSVFDDFVMDMFIDEDEEIEDAIKTDESLFNDYSAEQPELFNSTEMMVREAFNRCRVL